MKKPSCLSVIFLLLTFIVLFSCTKLFTHSSDDSLTKDSKLIQELKEYNKKYQAEHPKTKSLSWQRVTKIALDDIGGAYVGGKAGAKIGGYVGSYFVVSEISRDIIQSDSLRIALQNYYEARMYGALFEEDNYPGSSVDDIVELFLQPYQMNVNSPAEVVSLANDYIAIIAASNELDEVQQTQVYSTLAVAVYTSYYWSDYYLIAE